MTVDPPGEPPDHLSDWFWATVETVCRDPDRVDAALTAMEPGDLERLHRQLWEAVVELLCDPFTPYLPDSEDGAEDVAHWVVSRGRAHYHALWARPETFPSWRPGLPGLTVGQVAEVHHRRTGRTLEWDWD
ncbi:hypothetical protein [Embleya sp. NPDC059259]|uniref:hypothetical protein n=1 Tax=unclassified Embleya TaxID=2699296 RepID=UPI0036A36C77